MDKTKVIIVVILIALVGAGAAMKFSEQPPEPPQPEEPAPAATAKGAANPTGAKGAPSPNADSLQKTDIKVGTGKAAKAGDNITVNYRGRLTDGTIFDESYKRGEPFQFQLGAGRVIKGWDLGVVGMKEGGKRKLVIPSDLAYGPGGQPPTIPPNATLIFEIELLKVG